MLSAFHSQVALENWAHQNALVSVIAMPEDWPDQWRHSTAGLLPLWHGDYSMGLSATYAAVNGLRLVCAGQCQLNRHDEQSLLDSAWRWRLSRGAVLPNRGVRKGEWFRMVECLCLVFGRRHGHFVEVRQPWREGSPTRDQFLSSLERLIVGRHVVLSLFAGAHYSVIRGYTPSSLLLFDSAAQAWVKRNCTGLIGSTPVARHRILPSATLTLRRRM